MPDVGAAVDELGTIARGSFQMWWLAKLRNWRLTWKPATTTETSLTLVSFPEDAKVTLAGTGTAAASGPGPRVQHNEA